MQEILSFVFVLPEKQLNRDTKLIAILRRQFCIILAALEENIYIRDSPQYEIYFLPTCQARLNHRAPCFGLSVIIRILCVFRPPLVVFIQFSHKSL